MSVLAELDPAAAYPATVPEMGESPRHARAQFLAFGALTGHFSGRADCFVGQELNVYYRLGDGKTFVTPDVLVCFGVDAAALEDDVSYRIWDAGAPPAFVLEVASERTHMRDREEKPAIYLEVGVKEYWRFDHTGGEMYTPFLQGGRRAGDAWAPIAVAPDGEGRLCGRSAVLGLDLCAEERRLRFRDPATGGWLHDPDETGLALEQTGLALEQTRRERDAAQARAAAAEAEVAALRAKLRG